MAATSRKKPTVVKRRYPPQADPAMFVMTRRQWADLVECLRPIAKHFGDMEAQPAKRSRPAANGRAAAP